MRRVVGVAIVVLAVCGFVGQAQAADPVADYVERFERLRASLESADKDCAAAAGAIEGWHGKHGVEIIELDEQIRAAVAAGQLDASTLESHSTTIEAITEQLGATVEHCTDEASVIEALALLGDHSTPEAQLTASLRPVSPSPIAKFPWGPQCRRMLATMDSLCKAYLGQPGVAEMCSSWNDAWAAMPANTPASAFQQMEAGCAESIPALEQAAAGFAAMAPAPTP